MDALVQELDTKLRQWQPDIAQQVRQCLAEIIAVLSWVQYSNSSE